MSNNKKNKKEQIINFMVGLESGMVLSELKKSLISSQKSKSKPKPGPIKKNEEKK